MPANADNNKRPVTLLYWLLAIAALAAGVILSISSRNPVKPPALETATLLMPAKVISPQGLIDHNGKPFELQQLTGSYSFIFFGYTHCPDVCPATLFQFKTMAKMLQSYPELKDQTRFILVSIDPQRDTPQHLKEYVQYYHPDFIGVTGSPADIKTFSRQMGVIYERREAEDRSDSDNYLVDHSSAILMTNPAGQLQAVFSAPHNANTLVKDYQSIFNYLKGQQ